MINFSYRKVGGLHFIKLGRLTFSLSVAKPGTPFVPLKAPRRRTIGWRLSPMAWAAARGLSSYHQEPRT